MKKRPISISIIAWYLIATSPLALFFAVRGFNDPAVKQLMSQNPMPIPVQYFQLLSSLLISFVCGIAMLKGRNWSRYLYVIWGAIGFIIGIVITPFKVMMIPGILILLVVVFFLFRPKANEFFRPGPDETL
ncbi:MAG: hypothetical protein WA666_03635 [Nitrospirota bacterium]